MSTKLKSVSDAFVLTVAGIVAALVAASLIGAIVAEFHAQGTALARTIQYAQVQVGFLTVALSYLLYFDAPDRFAKFHFPSLRDIGWRIGFGGSWLVEYLPPSLVGSFQTSERDNGVDPIPGPIQSHNCFKREFALIHFLSVVGSLLNGFRGRVRFYVEISG